MFNFLIKNYHLKTLTQIIDYQLFTKLYHTLSYFKHDFN